ncbi:MAG: hypothetical protein O7I93_01800 [Gemmatimonadetes bacterium]|nr:hypothetical protein [Gemmatimonadota bacterium]
MLAAERASARFAITLNRFEEAKAKGSERIEPATARASGRGGAEPHHQNIGESRQNPAVRDPLGLTDEDIAALVDFLRFLTDPGNGLDATLGTVSASGPSGLMPVYGVAGN